MSHAAQRHLVDFGSLVAVWVAWFWAVNWNIVAAFLSCVFTLLLILDKLGILAPLKARFAALLHGHEPPAPRVRAPQDE